MRYFERDGRFNWVDENNVLLGFAALEACLESFGWYYADKPDFTRAATISHSGEPDDLADWRFDPEFFESHDMADHGGPPWTDDGGVAAFRIVNGDQSKYLHIYNIHNGYYSHGFKLEVGGEAVREGYL